MPHFGILNTWQRFVGAEIRMANPPGREPRDCTARATPLLFRVPRVRLQPHGESAVLAFAVGSIIAIGFIVLMFLRRKANSGSRGLLGCHAEIKGGKSLVVLAYGTQNTAIYLDSLNSILAEVRSGADVLTVEYTSDALSNADPFLISEQICQAIQDAYEKGKYDCIILVGYSKGALLVRKALVYGYGHIEDLDTELSGASRPVLSWVGAVDRLVLLAGMNRGWTLRNRPKQMSLSRFWMLKFLSRFARAFHIGMLMNRCESGEPFVSNLRLQWLDVMRSLPAKGRPTVIQLLGDKDDLVSSEDQRDVTIAKDFIWVRVNNTGHPDIVELDDPVLGPERRNKIKKALGDAADIEALRRLSSKLPDNEDPEVEEVVVVLHGIRDMASWTSQFEAPLQEAYQAKHPASASKIHITWPSYGYFGMGPFLLWADRQKNVRWFMDEYTELKAKYPNVQKVHFIGHSNGTYVLASALENYKTLKVGNIAFGGCVLRRDFNWAGVGAQFDRVRNYVGSKDWVVGWFPALFEYPVLNLWNKDIGSAGFNGFITSEGNALETRFLDGAHSIALDPRNIGSIVEFIIDGKRVDNPDLLNKRGPTWKMEFSSKFCWLIWVLIVAVIVALFALWILLFLHFMPAVRWPFDVALAVVTFIPLVVMVLKTV
jgi:predicted esterase